MTPRWPAIEGPRPHAPHIPVQITQATHDRHPPTQAAFSNLASRVKRHKGRIERAVKAIVLPNSPGLLRLRKSLW